MVRRKPLPFEEATHIRELQRLAAEMRALQAEAEHRRCEEDVTDHRTELTALEEGWRAALSNPRFGSSIALAWSASIQGQMAHIAEAESLSAAARVRSEMAKTDYQQASARQRVTHERARHEIKAAARIREQDRDRTLLESYVANLQRRGATP